MIILSVGMPRAGSGWYYNLTHDLILAGGGQDARQIRRRYHLQNILTEVNCNIGVLSPRRLLAVLLPSLMGNTFVIKAHAGPTPFAEWLLRRGWMKAAYIYRDPRDAMLSAFENGRRAVQKGRPNAFSHLTDFEASLDFIGDYIHIAEAWLAIQDILHTPYEDLVADYDPQAARLAKYLSLDGGDRSIQAIVDKYRPEQAGAAEQKGLHFSQGKRGRYLQKYSQQQQEAFLKLFGGYLEKMGYPI